MSENPHKTISVKLADGSKHQFNVYWDKAVFPKAADERVVDNLIEIIKESPEEYITIMKRNGKIRVKSTYRAGRYYTIKKNGASPSLLITK